MTERFNSVFNPDPKIPATASAPPAVSDQVPDREGMAAGVLVQQEGHGSVRDTRHHHDDSVGPKVPAGSVRQSFSYLRKGLRNPGR